jgi:hypothetical protein
MGTDIHWLLERQHKSGSWHAVAEKNTAFDAIREANPGSSYALFESPAKLAADQDYIFFGLLADVRNDCLPTPERLLMLRDLPDDMADITAAWCNEQDSMWGYHTAGWADLGRIKSWSLDWSGWLDIDDEDTPSEAELRAQIRGSEAEIRAMIRDRQNALISILSEDIYFTRTLRLPLRDKDLALDFGESQASAHQQIEDQTIFNGLKPIADDTVRYFFRFDS